MRVQRVKKINDHMSSEKQFIGDIDAGIARFNGESGSLAESDRAEIKDIKENPDMESKENIIETSELMKDPS